MYTSELDRELWNIHPNAYRIIFLPRNFYHILLSFCFGSLPASCLIIYHWIRTKRKKKNEKKTSFYFLNRPNDLYKASKHTRTLKEKKRIISRNNLIFSTLQSMHSGCDFSTSRTSWLVFFLFFFECVMNNPEQFFNDIRCSKIHLRLKKQRRPTKKKLKKSKILRGSK